MNAEWLNTACLAWSCIGAGFGIAAWFRARHLARHADAVRDMINARIDRHAVKLGLEVEARQTRDKLTYHQANEDRAAVARLQARVTGLEKDWQAIVDVLTAPFDPPDDHGGLGIGTTAHPPVAEAVTEWEELIGHPMARRSHRNNGEDAD